MSVSRVHPPQVHQQRDLSPAAARLAGHPPNTVWVMFGIVIPDAATSEIHCCTSGESVAGGTSNAGYLLGTRRATARRRDR